MWSWILDFLTSFSSGRKDLKSIWRPVVGGRSRERAFCRAPRVLRVLPCSWSRVLCSCDSCRPTCSQVNPGSVGLSGSTWRLPAGGGRATLDCENPPHVVWPPRGGVSSRRHSGSNRALLDRRRRRTRTLAFSAGHEVVVVSIATSKPEVNTLCCDDIIVVAGFPAAAGAGGARQRADRALNCSKETEQRRVFYLLMTIIFVTMKRLLIKW